MESPVLRMISFFDLLFAVAICLWVMRTSNELVTDEPPTSVQTVGQYVWEMVLLKRWIFVSREFALPAVGEVAKILFN